MILQKPNKKQQKTCVRACVYIYIHSLTHLSHKYNLFAAFSPDKKKSTPMASASNIMHIPLHSFNK